MTTPLRKPMSRKVAGHVVTMGPDGLRIRAVGKRRAVTVSWEWLFVRLPWPAADRAEAFSRPLPPAWLPKKGDWVFVTPIAGTMSNVVAKGRVTAVLPGCGGELIRVLFRYGKRQLFEVYPIGCLRPCIETRVPAASLPLCPESPAPNPSPPFPDP